MIDYATVGSDDLAKSRRFYDAILAPLGGEVIIEAPKMVFYSRPGTPMSMLAVCLPYDGEACSAGNGIMLALSATSNAIVDEVYKIAMELGMEGEGAPGFRVSNMYICYFRDPYRNKLAVYHIPSVEEFAVAARDMVKAMVAAGAGGGEATDAARG